MERDRQRGKEGGRHTKRQKDRQRDRVRVSERERGRKWVDAMRHISTKAWMQTLARMQA